MNEARTASTTPSYKRVVTVEPKKSLSRPKNAERAMIINLIVEGLMPAKGRTEWKTKNSAFINSLLKTPNLVYLRQILDLVPYATKPEEISFIIREATDYFRRDFKGLHANREFLNEDISMETIKDFSNKLVVVGYESGSHIPTLPSHLLAQEVFKSSLDWSEYSIVEYLFRPDTYCSSGICSLVEEYVAEIDLIVHSMKSGITTAAGLKHILEGRPSSLATGAI